MLAKLKREYHQHNLILLLRDIHDDSLTRPWTRQPRSARHPTTILNTNGTLGYTETVPVLYFCHMEDDIAAVYDYSIRLSSTVESAMLN